MNPLFDLDAEPDDYYTNSNTKSPSITSVLKQRESGTRVDKKGVPHKKMISNFWKKKTLDLQREINRELKNKMYDIIGDGENYTMGEKAEVISDIMDNNPELLEKTKLLEKFSEPDAEEYEAVYGNGRNPYALLEQKGHEGKFTAQFKARKPHLRHLKNLEEFAHYILANPTEFNKISKQRANYYKNLIEPKIGGLTPKMMKDLRAYHRQVGGKISAKDFELMLQETYKSPDKRDKNIGDYNIDESLSTPENVVYHNPKTGETKVAYRGTEGTLKDWGNNALYAFGLHNTSKRYKRSNEIQKQVEQKYGTQNLDVLGHSQSGAYAQEIGKNAKNVIVLNPATHPGYTPKTKNATIVRSKGDAVSGLKYLNPLNWGKKKTADVEIEAKTYNPVTEHMPAVLERLPEETILGNGRRRKRRNVNKKLLRLCNCGMCPFCR